MAEESKLLNKERPPVTANARVKNNAGSKRLAEAFLAEDVENAKSYIFWDVIIPTLKDGIGLTLHSAVDAIFGGGSRRGGYGRTSYGNSSNHVNYSKISSVSANSSRAREDRSYNVYSFDDIEIDDSGVANLILDDLNDICDEYGSCSVNDYFEVVKQYIRGIRIDSTAQDNDYGWTSLRAARVERAGRGMYYIKFPRVRPLK